MSFLRKFFLVREIKSKKGVLHFERWRILNLGLFAIYIHRIYVSDADKHQHSHPWWFFSKILAGSYYEMRGNRGRLMAPGYWATMKPKEFHKITVLEPVTSFVVTGPRIHEWGYMTDDGYVEAGQYRINKRNGMY